MSIVFDQLLSSARHRLRWDESRRWMLMASWGVAATLLALSWTHQPRAWWLLLAVPAAGAVGYFRKAIKDLEVARHLDEQLHTRDLIATAVACRGGADEASRMIVAQAECWAAGADLAPAFSRGIRRSEVAAFISLLIVVTIGLIRPTAPESAQRDTVAARVPSPASVASNDRAVRPSTAERKPSPGGESDLPADQATQDATAQASRVDASAQRDASGDGQSLTASRVEAKMRAVAAKTSADAGVSPSGSGPSTRFETAGDRPGGGIAVRAPTDTRASLPSGFHSDLSALNREIERLDIESRDLVRAYFDLDTPR